MTIRYFVVLMINLSFIGISCADMRTWVNKNGHTIDAELISADSSTVTLRSKTGKSGILQRDELSVQDQEYVSNWIQEQNKPATWDWFGFNKRSTGNEFTVNLYDLKRDREGNPTRIGQLMYNDRGQAVTYNPEVQELYFKAIKSFATSHNADKWAEKQLKNFYKSSITRYANSILLPPHCEDDLNVIFDLQKDVEPYYFIVHYNGQILSPTKSRYRFCGLGDEFLLVKVDGNLVLDAQYPSRVGRKEWITNWQSTDSNSGKYPLKWIDGSRDNNGMVIGDWFELSDTKKADIEVLVGNITGGFGAVLLVQQEGVNYPVVNQFAHGAIKRPILPVFKTDPLSEDQMRELKISPDESTFEGPVFGIHINGKNN